MNAMRLGLGLGVGSALAGGGGPQLLAVPTGFGWTPPVNVYRNSDGTYETDYDPTPFLVEGDPGVTTYYVDSATGSEANPGTAAQPKASLRTISTSRTTKLLIKARGTFYGNITAAVFVPHDTLCVEAWGGAECIITTETNASFPFVWTDEGGGVWSAPSPHSGMNGINVYSGTNVETLVYYPLAASLAACQATPGTIFRETSPSIKHYVHTLDGTSPASGHTIYGTSNASENVGLGSYAYDQRIAFHGVSFRGGSSAVTVSGSTSYTKRVDFVGCDFKHANNFAAFHSTGNPTIILYGCTAGPSRFDGFSATTATGSAGGDVPKVVEINCIGRNNGVTSAANQGSTSHFGGKHVRVNCQYYGNANDQVADVGAGTCSWNVGVAVGPDGIGSGFSGFQCGNDGTDPKMWLDGCTFTAVDYDVCAQNAAATILYRNMAAPSVKPASTGTIGTY